jgi:hypothetical protein
MGVADISPGETGRQWGLIDFDEGSSDFLPRLS